MNAQGTDIPAAPAAPHLLEVDGLRKYFAVRTGWFQNPKRVHAVDQISFSIPKAQAFGLVGESGCGKTTTARVIAGLYAPDGGRISFEGADLASLTGDALRTYRRNVQMVFQDPFESLNPRRTVYHILRQPLMNFGICPESEFRGRVEELLDMVGLSPGGAFADRYAHQLSGGQRQRIGIARALSLSPRLVIADEPVASLDISIRAQILNLMKKLQREFHLSYLFITHDLGVVRSLCDRTAVMYVGKIVEHAGTDSLFHEPMHPYTRALISATPLPDPVKARARKRVILKGEVPSAVDPPSGCRFHPRCPYAEERCRVDAPLLRELRPGHAVACHLAEQLPTAKEAPPAAGA